MFDAEDFREYKEPHPHEVSAVKRKPVARPPTLILRADKPDEGEFEDIELNPGWPMKQPGPSVQVY